MLQYRRLKPSQELLRFLKRMRFKQGARVSVVVGNKEFYATYEVLKIGVVARARKKI
jgi:hypothetical protein